MIEKRTQLFFFFFSLIALAASLVSYSHYVIRKDFLVFTNPDTIPEGSREAVQAIITNELSQRDGVLPWNN